MYEMEECIEYGGGGIGSLSTREVGIAGLNYVPDLAPVGSGSAGSYYPRDTSGDAAALNYLGYFPEPLYKSHKGTSGSQAADMAAKTGAWAPDFQQAVRYFQEANGLAADGWIGPATRTKLAALVTAKNASGDSSIPTIPVIPTPNGGGVQPVSAKTSNMGLYLGIGAGLLGLGGVYWLLSE